jgi:hypothetical protein
MTLVPKNNIINYTHYMLTRKRVSLSLKPETLRKLDKARGDVSRSLFVTRMVEGLSL